MTRSIFEDVSADKPGAKADAAKPEAPKPGAAEAARLAGRRRTAFWLLALAGLVIAQILLGGLTRLTDSGLSITDWRPITGFLPPFSDADWQALFARYQETDEFKLQNSAMTLAEFKPIYWWEWSHRNLGRFIGLAFVIPFLWLYLSKAMPAAWTGRILLLGVLGGLQGLVGWWMVASGLTGRLDVSQYRLAVHLGLAFVILGGLFWAALSLLREERDLLQARRRREAGVPALAAALTAFVFVQIVLGAFVAGMDGGFIYAEWPTMGGAFYPPGEPFSPFEEPAAAQFLHRITAYLLLAAAIAFWWRARRSAAAKTRLWATIVLGVCVLQSVLGIATVLNAATTPLAFLHQFTAILLFSVAVHLTHQASFPKEERIAAP